MYPLFTCRCLFLGLGLLFFMEQVRAQDFQTSARKQFGLLIGTDVSAMNFNRGYPVPAVPVTVAWKVSFMVGFVANVPLSNNLILQPGYTYTLRYGTNKSTHINYVFNYVSLPLLLKYQFAGKVSLLAGPQAELLVKATSDSNGVKSGITHDVEERSIGATIGVEVELTHSFSLSFRYMHGLNHIGIGQRSDVKEFKYQGLNLLIGMRL